jgi:hypothetical protein
MEATEELKEQFEHVGEEKFEDIGDLDQYMEDGAPEVELKPLPRGLKYEFLGDNKTFPVIVSDTLNPEETEKLLKLLRENKKVIGYSINDLKGISPAFCTHRIRLEEQCKLVIEHQRRLSHGMRDVVKKEVIKLLNAGIIYPVPLSEWVSPVHCVPKKGGLTVVKNEKDQLIPQRTVTGWRMCHCLSNLAKVLARCGEVDLVLNWEKCHFMVREGIVLGHVISERGIEMDKAKIETVEKLPPPTDIKFLRSFLGHAGFYRRFIKDFSKITKPLTQLLQKDTKFIFDSVCLHAFRNSSKPS